MNDPLFNPLSANPTKLSITLKKCVDYCQQIVCVFDHFVGFAFKGL